MKVAIVTDWLITVGGAEQVLKSIHEMYPQAPIYTSQYNKKGIDWFKNADVRTGWLQIFPSGCRRFLGPLRQFYFSHLDLSEYDLIISVTGAEAKSVKKGSATHICYCHVPTQYYWQFYDKYLENPGFGPLDPLARLGLKLLVRPLRKADYKAAQRPDYFVTISSYAAEEIKKAYNREASIIFPPVNTSEFHRVVEKNTIKKGKSQASKSEQTITSNNIKSSKSQIYINYSRQVTWKRLDIIVKSFKNTKLPLLLIGDGPEHNNLVKIANGAPNITFLPALPQADLIDYLKNSKAFIFPSMEPFGIAPVEALAAGVPVIAYKGGGALDYIKDGKNGLLFNKQTPDSLTKVIKKFEQAKLDSPEKISKSVENFSAPRFKKAIKDFINEKTK